MPPIDVAVLWHMHQPDYRDPESGRLTLPWVRLHGIKGYYDMVHVLRRAAESAQSDADHSVRAVFNFVPILVRQIQGYVDGEFTDTYLMISEKPTADLHPDERAFVAENFFHANHRTMVDVHPRYRELRQNAHTPTGNVRDLPEQDIRDIVVWFNLAWFGYTARKHYPRLTDLIAKGRDFTEDEKAEVLGIQREVLERVLPAYRKAAEDGLIELTTTPYYHPILPLLCDTDSAKPGLPGRDLPNPPFRAPEDAAEHVRRALASHEETFGQKPRGMWPAEGSVSPTVIEILADQGVQWIATDQDVLLRSGGKLKQRDVYYPYRTGMGERKVNMVFRDLGISNAIGFTYTNMDPEDSIADMMRRLKAIRDSIEHPEQALISIILDGENAWEYYSDGSERFLTQMYRAIADSDDFRWTTIGDRIVEHPPQRKIDKIFPGSWINANFDVWIGAREENEGWAYLRDTRAALVAANDSLDDDARKRAWENLYAAEGSDWFWWYSDDFSTALQSEFDRLFRAHLAGVFRAIGERVPRWLLSPIKRDQVAVGTAPRGLIVPKIDGRVSSYYEWIDAGVFDVRKSHGAMAQDDQRVTKLYFGYDHERIVYRIDLSHPPSDEMFRATEFVFEFPEKPDISLHMGMSDGVGSTQVYISEAGRTVRMGLVVAADRVIECSAPFASLGYKPGDTVEFVLVVRENGNEIERWPRDSFLSFDLPTADYDLEHWTV